MHHHAKKMKWWLATWQGNMVIWQGNMVAPPTKTQTKKRHLQTRVSTIQASLAKFFVTSCTKVILADHAKMFSDVVNKMLSDCFFRNGLSIKRTPGPYASSNWTILVKNGAKNLLEK